MWFCERTAAVLHCYRSIVVFVLRIITGEKKGKIRDFPTMGASEQTPCCENECQVTMTTVSPPLVCNVCRRRAAIGWECWGTGWRSLLLTRWPCCKGQKWPVLKDSKQVTQKHSFNAGWLAPALEWGGRTFMCLCPGAHCLKVCLCSHILIQECLLLCGALWCIQMPNSDNIWAFLGTGEVNYKSIKACFFAKVVQGDLTESRSLSSTLYPFIPEWALCCYSKEYVFSI